MEFKKLKVGEKLSETQYYSVAKIAGDKVQLQNDLGENIVVDSKYVDSCLTSANQFDKTTSVNKTEMASLFLKSSEIAMTVNFNKQVKEVDLIKEIMEAYEGSTLKAMELAVKKAVKKGLSGEERTMIGRHSGELNELGRVSFVDMEATSDKGKGFDSRLRLVDPRTINYLIVKGVKYVAK